jgi:hypothetical protein
LTLSALLEDIDANRLLLPHIQRAFVWEDDQMERLFDSLMRGYPIQTLLFWKTKDEIRARRFMAPIDRDIELSELYDVARSAAGREKTFVLDGQQRLQTLHALFRGGVKGGDGVVRHAYMDITSGGAPEETGDLLHKLSYSAEELPLPSVRLSDLASRLGSRRHADLAYDLADQLQASHPLAPDAHRARERLIGINIGQLNSILHEDKHFWIDELDGITQKYPYQRVLEIFVRVNSGGTKLTAGDLMFAAMKEGWDDIEERVDQTVEMLRDGRLDISKELVLKCLLLIEGEGAEVQNEKFLGERGRLILARMEEHWDRAEVAFRELRDFMVHELRLSSDRIVKTYNALIPLFVYLYRHPQPTPAVRRRMAAYFYKAQLFGWFGARGDPTLNALCRIIEETQTKDFPLEAIKDYFRSTRHSSVELSPYHLDNKSVRPLLLNIVYLDTFGGSPFDVAFRGNEPHVDHIYPQYMLRSRLGCGSAEINDIGNLRLVGATDNIRKRAQLPADYFGELKHRKVPVAKHLLVPEFGDDPKTLVFDRPTYDRFRNERRELLWRALQRIVDPEVRPASGPVAVPSN